MKPRTESTNKLLKILGTLLAFSYFCLPAKAQLNQNCVVSVLNRTTKVNPDGTWVLPTVPANFGPVRARATCVENGVTTFGQSDLFTVGKDQTVNLPLITLGQTTPIPSAITISSTSATLTQAGATVSLKVTATYADGTTKDVTAASSGTQYVISNPGVATITAGGLVTAVSTGTVIIEAANEGTQGMTTIHVLLAGASHGGIPDDWALSHGLDPNDPAMPFEDPDHDGLTNLQEFQSGTDPHNADTDGDGLTDGQEALMYHTNPALADTDGDGIPDGLEVNSGTDPLNAGSYNLHAVLSSIEVTPTHFTLFSTSQVNQATQQLQVTGHLADGKTTIDLTSTAKGTNYSSSDLNICNFGGPDGNIFAGSNGACTITVTNSGFSAISTGVVAALNPTALSWISIPGSANKVRVNGNYAYIAAGSAGLQIVDVTDRTAPRIASSLALPGNANELRIVGNRLYMAADSAGLQIINIANPLAPALLGSIKLPGVAWDVAVSGNLAYVAAGASGLQIADVSNPTSPAALGAVAIPGTAKGVDVQGTIAVVAAGTGGVKTVDVSVSGSPRVIGSVVVSGDDARKVTVQGTTAFVAAYTGSLHIVDFSNPTSPKVLGTTLNHFDSSGNDLGGYLQDVALSNVNGTVYALGADVKFVNGVPITDVTTPSNPISVAILDFSKCAGCRDDNGTGIADDNRYVYLTAELSNIDENAAVNNTRLYIGQYFQIVDTAGIPPQISILSPTIGTSLRGGTPITVAANASDDVAVATVDFFVNGSHVFTSTTAPYQFTYDVPTDATSLVFAARATDFGGNFADAVPVTLTNTPLTSLAVSPGSAVIPLHGAQQFTATGTFADGSTMDLSKFASWSSSVPAVATVNGTGLATVVGTGQTTIQAQIGSLTASATLSKQAPTLVSIAVTPSNPVLEFDAIQQLTATATNSEGSLMDVTNTATWSSFAPGIATVSSMGLLTAVSQGQTTIQASVGAIYGLSMPLVTSVSGTSSMNIARVEDTATLLNNGKVLVVGGIGATDQLVATAELYDPATGRWSLTGSLLRPRYEHAATLLDNGKVLITGGIESITQGTDTASAELYDPLTGTFSDAGNMNSPHFTHLAINLNDGTVFIYGGINSDGSGPVNAETYDPATGKFTQIAATPPIQIFQPTGVRLNDGTVVAVSRGFATKYDSVAHTFTDLPGYPNFSLQPTASLLNNGLALFAGGLNPGSFTPAWNTAALYSPKTQNFSATGLMGTAHAEHTATLLTNGTVLIAGGQDGYEINRSVVGELYDPATQTFSQPADLTLTPRTRHSATLLKDGTVLLAGGVANPNANVSFSLLGTAEIYHPISKTITGLVSISLTPVSPIIAVGTSQRLVATGTFSDGSTQQLESVTWNAADVSGANVAQVTNDSTNHGAALGVSPGTAVITASAGAVSGSATLTVIPLVSITVSPANSFVQIGNTQQFTATGTFQDGSTQDLTALVAWSTSSANATIAPGGLLTGVAKGAVTVQATYARVTGSTSMAVTATLVSIAVTPSNPILSVGTKQQFTASATFADGTVQQVDPIWSTTDLSGTNVAQISNDAATRGMALASSPGTASITATVDSVSGSTTLTVTSIVSIAVSPANPSVPLGATQQFAAIGTLLDGSTQDVTALVSWNVLSGAVAITPTGLLTGSAKGPAAIRAKYGNLYGSTTLIVVDAALSSIAVTPANASIPSGTKQRFTATGTYTDGSKLDLTATATWSSSVSAVATIGSGGLADAVMLGQTTIQASAGVITGSALLTVTQSGLGGTGNLISARQAHTETLLANGKVLLTGGLDVNGVPTATAELYDPSTGIFSLTGSMVNARAYHTATLLTNGKVLIVGGGDGRDFSATAELYDPLTGAFASTGNLGAARGFHTATLLGSGRVLVTGGEITVPPENGSDAIASAELYDPASGQFSSAGNMSMSRAGHTATVLNDGTVLIVGGCVFACRFNAGPYVTTGAEIYNPDNGTFSVTPGLLSFQRVGHTATRLNDGTVLIAGGSGSNTVDQRYGVAVGPVEIYNPATGSFTSGASLQTPRYWHTATLLNNGMVFVAGGSVTSGDSTASAELFDPASGTFSSAGNLASARARHSATLLSNGTVLLAGGFDGNNSVFTGLQVTSGDLSSAELYQTSDSGLVSIVVTPAAPVLAMGKTQQFVAKGTFQDGSVQQLAAVVWSSSDPNVAEISNDKTSRGVALDLAVGVATINASSGGVQSSATLTSQFLLSSIEVTPSNPSIPSGTTQQFVATGHLSDGTTQNLTAFATWNSATHAVASMGAGGLATGLSQGTTSISASFGGVSGSALLSVGAPVLVSLDLTPLDPTIFAGGVQQFAAIGTYSDGSTLDLTAVATWSTSDPTLATISSTGFASAFGFTGMVTISASFRGRGGGSILTINLAAPGAFGPAGTDLTEPRSAHTATVLNGGRVLMALGFYDSGGDALSSVDIYDPASGRFAEFFPGLTPRGNHTATVLNDGTILFAGGSDGGFVLNRADVYDPSASVVASPLLNEARQDHTASLLSDGTVLIVGGRNNAGEAVSAEIYDPVGFSFRAIQGLNTPRHRHTATILNDGRVLIAGGFDSNGNVLNTIEMFDPAQSAFTLLTPRLFNARANHTATLLDDGRVLIAGGTDGTQDLITAELYDPRSNTVTPAGNMSFSRQSHTATVLNNGTVLIAGGTLVNSDLFDPVTNSFTATSYGFFNGVGETATLLNNGNVLMAGGQLPGNQFPFSGAEIYVPISAMPPDLVSIAVTPGPATATVSQGTAQQFIATGTFSDGTKQQFTSLTWSSSNTAVAQVTNDATNRGTVLGIAAGTSVITATVGEISASVTVTIQ